LWGKCDVSAGAVRYLRVPSRQASSEGTNVPFPKRITSFNHRVANPIMRKLAVHAPGMAVVNHRGRRSGKRYETPVLIFANGKQITLALTYGTDVDWLKNVRAANGCRLVRRGRVRDAKNPRMLSTEEGMRRMPAPIRWILRLSNVREFVELTET
jgi:deazaflavin-dependent oxidoreductase (nitroreductase family)